MTDPQQIANDIRDRLVDHPTVGRLGIEVLWTAGASDGLTVRARHRDRVLTIERGASWLRGATEDLAAELVQELVGEALANGRDVTPPPSWRRPEPRSGPAPTP